MKWQFISKNVMENVDAPKFERRDIVTWSMDEVRKFLDNVPADQYRIAFILALYTGMRRGEILGLRWKDVDLKTGKASIRQALTKTKMGLIFQEPKTKNAKRQIALSQEVISALKKHKHWVNKNMVQHGPEYQNHDLVCCHEDGRPIAPRTLQNVLHKRCEALELPNIRFHDLRHTHATIMLQLGQHPKVVSERLGHGRVGITMDIYSYVLPDMQKDAADIFESALKKGL
ncbi:site-specific integrase [Paenibacillus larvae]